MLFDTLCVSVKFTRGSLAIGLVENATIEEFEESINVWVSLYYRAGVSFPGFLDFMEYNFLIRRLEIDEFGPVGKRATGINEASFAALNRGRQLYSAGLPSRWALAHIWEF